MFRSFSLAMCVTALLVTSAIADDTPDAAKAAAEIDVEVTVDASLAPDIKDWLDRAGELAKKEYPKLAATLASDGFVPPREVKIIADPALKVPGATLRSTIRVSPEWVRKHPDDWGMVVHELVHVVQRYPRGPGWVTEGIADWYRYYIYEPGSPRARFNPRSADYKRGYQPTAALFDYIAREHDKQIVTELNAAMRSGRYSDELIKQRTGKTFDELWQDYLATRRGN